MSYKTYNISTGLKRAKRKISVFAVGLTAVTVPAVMALSSGGAAAITGGYSLFGDAQIVSPGHNSPHAAQTESSATVSPGYGGVDFGVPSGVTTVSSLNSLSTDYKFTQGSCGGGSPRFSVEVTTPTGPENLFVYIGPAPSYTGCAPNVWTNTSNLASPANLVDASQLGGTFYEPYASVQAAYGSYPITNISLVTDAYWFAGTQTVQFDNVVVDNNTFTFDQPVNKDECKNGGWMNLTDSNGRAFKNQGDCVSYVATHGRNGANG